MKEMLILSVFIFASSITETKTVGSRPAKFLLNIVFKDVWTTNCKGIFLKIAVLHSPISKLIVFIAYLFMLTSCSTKCLFVCLKFATNLHFFNVLEAYSGLWLSFFTLQLNVSSRSVFDFILWQHCAYCLVRFRHINNLFRIMKRSCFAGPNTA